MSAFTVILAGLFSYIGGRMLLGTLVTGTTASDNVVTMFIPLALALVAVAVVMRLFMLR